MIQGVFRIVYSLAVLHKLLQHYKLLMRNKKSKTII